MIFIQQCHLLIYIDLLWQWYRIVDRCNSLQITWAMTIGLFQYADGDGYNSCRFLNSQYHSICHPLCLKEFKLNLLQQCWLSRKYKGIVPLISKLYLSYYYTGALGLSCHNGIPLISHNTSAGQLYTLAESLKPVISCELLKTWDNIYPYILSLDESLKRSLLFEPKPKIIKFFGQSVSWS